MPASHSSANAANVASTADASGAAPLKADETEGDGTPVVVIPEAAAPVTLTPLAPWATSLLFRTLTKVLLPLPPVALVRALATEVAAVAEEAVTVKAIATPVFCSR